MSASPSKFHSAVQTLFGPEKLIAPGDLSALDLDDLKARFRQKAIATHPDRASALGRDPEELSREFLEIVESYQFLSQLASAQQKVAAAGMDAWPSRKRGERPSKNGTFFFHKGPVPEKKLRFAEFLFYKQVISWQVLIQMLSGQRMKRPRLGEIGMRWRYFDHTQLLSVIRSRKPKEIFGEAALRLGLVNTYKLFAMIGKQKSFNYPIGRVFVEEKILTPGDLVQFVRELERHNSRFPAG